MRFTLSRRSVIAAGAALLVAFPAMAQDKIQLRLSTPASETDSRAVALIEEFGPAVADFADFEPHWNGTLFGQGNELEAIARGNLEMAITSAQELAVFFPEFSIFTAGYVMQDPEHQKAVFDAPLMDPFKQKVEDELSVKLLNVMYLGKRHVNLRGDREVRTPDDLAGVRLRMPGTDAWQFLGRALGADPTPMAFTEVYTALQTGAIDGQDNPLPTVVDAKFYEVTDQIVLTAHLVDFNYLALSLEKWNEMTPEQQQALQDAADAAADANLASKVQDEEELVSFLEDKGLNLYEPDLEAFRSTVQEAYLSSDYANDWPDGVLEKINALAE